MEWLPTDSGLLVQAACPAPFNVPVPNVAPSS